MTVPLEQFMAQRREIEALKAEKDIGDRLIMAVVAWLDENARRCAHGCIHVTCGDCLPVPR